MIKLVQNACYSLTYKLLNIREALFDDREGRGVRGGVTGRGVKEVWDWLLKQLRVNLLLFLPLRLNLPGDILQLLQDSLIVGLQLPRLLQVRPR